MDSPVRLLTVKNKYRTTIRWRPGGLLNVAVLTSTTNTDQQYTRHLPMHLSGPTPGPRDPYQPPRPGPARFRSAPQSVTRPPVLFYRFALAHASVPTASAGPAPGHRWQPPNRGYASPPRQINSLTLGRARRPSPCHTPRPRHATTGHNLTQPRWHDQRYDQNLKWPEIGRASCRDRVKVQEMQIA